MLKVKSIKTNVIISGLYMGVPATVITVMKNGKRTEQNEIIDTVRNFGHKYVVISGSVTENPEIKSLVVGLVSIGYTIIIATTSEDDIESLRSTRNVNFLINVIPPTETQNTVNHKMLPYLKPTDELMFTVDKDETYTASIMFLKSKLITKPTITFVVQEGSKLKDQVIEDSKNFTFNTRVLPTNLND